MDTLSTAIKKRNIPFLVHFTRMENLDSIIRYGLVPRAQLPRIVGPAPLTNDSFRTDRILDGNCLSVSFPNYRMFFKYRQMSPGNDWAVLLWDTACITPGDTVFCATNAASYLMHSATVAERQGADAFEKLFAGSVLSAQGVVRRTPAHELWMPTDVQAEVLVRKIIPFSLCRGILFKDNDTMQRWVTGHGAYARLSARGRCFYDQRACDRAA